MRTLIIGRAVVTPSRRGGVAVRDGAAVLVEEDRIVAVDGAERLVRAFPRARRLGDAGALVLPGLVNAHSHGMGVTHAELGTPDLPLELWSVAHLGRPRPPRREETALSAVRQLRAGITTTVHSQGGGAATDADAILLGYGDAGIRTVLAVHARNQNRIAYEPDEAFLGRLAPSLAARVAAAFPLPAAIDPGAWLEGFAELAGRHEGARVRLAYGPAGVQWVDPAFLRLLTRRAVAEGRLLHTHLLESPYERLYGPRRLREDTVPWLSRHRVLGRHLTGAHGVWLSPRDMEILARSGASLVHCPSSNLRLGSGRMPLPDVLAAGVPVALGLDSCSLCDDEDLFTEMRLAKRLHSIPGIPGRRLSDADVLSMATSAGARSIGREGELGALREGYLADLVVLRGEAIDPLGHLAGASLLGAIVARARPEHVALTMVGGEVLWDGARHPRLSELELTRRAREVAPARKALVALRAPLADAIARFYESWNLPERRRRARRPWKAAVSGGPAPRRPGPRRRRTPAAAGRSSARRP